MINQEAQPWLGEEEQSYLDHFRGLQDHRFAVIKIGGELISDDKQLDLIASSLETLWGLGLYPVIVHGGGPQIDKGLKEAGIVTDKEDGLRKTSEGAAKLIPGLLHSVNDRLVTAINRNNYVADGIVSGVFTGNLRNQDDYGSVDSVGVSTIWIDRYLEDGIIPIISCAGKLAVQETAILSSDTPVNINADIAAVALAKTLSPEKFISLTSTGAVLGADGQPISLLSENQAEELIVAGTINCGMNVKVRQAMDLLNHGIRDIVITSPGSLLNGLFTGHGDGTLIRKG